LVPADAVIFNASGVHVAVLENGVAHMQDISIARDLGTAVEVREGVNPGDQVILNPPIDLVEGSRAQARPETTAAK
jgi:hypothetical protein